MARWIIRPGKYEATRAVTVRVPGDKSIGHRAVMLSALADGVSRITGLSGGEDNRSTVACLRALGVDIEEAGAGALLVRGVGLGGLRSPAGDLDCGNSGTTMRLMAGVLAGQALPARLVGDASLSRRPMRRVIEPLEAMGARVVAEGEGGRPPLRVWGGGLRGIAWMSPVASAQVKSAILLAGLRAEGETSVTEPALSRDHTERMLRRRGVDVRVDGLRVSLEPVKRLDAMDVDVPGDPSSAAFPLAMAILTGAVTVAGVGVNPTRTGFLDALQAMGAAVAVSEGPDAGGEPTADLRVERVSLRGAVIEGALIPRLIDEVPILAVLATQARGVTEIRDAAELRVKESDRIAVVAAHLRALGGHVEERPDGLIVEGPTPLRGARLESHGDHRIAMAGAVAGLIAKGETIIEDVACVATSFPGFVELLRRVVPAAEILEE
ncbi:MAG: 3-phosphoshikimate 1-carboxyvinyltransferase [Myxococcales bacterium]